MVVGTYRTAVIMLLVMVAEVAGAMKSSTAMENELRTALKKRQVTNITYNSTRSTFLHNLHRGLSEETIEQMIGKLDSTNEEDRYEPLFFRQEPAAYHLLYSKHRSFLAQVGYGSNARSHGGRQRRT